MTTVLDLRGRFCEFLADRLALNFPPARWSDIERALKPVARDLDFADVEDYAGWLTTAPLTQADFDTLASRLTVGETYFYREPQAFEALRREIVPELVARRGAAGQLRVWSAGCSTGEEPYSLAIGLRRHLPELQGWKLSILGTDINPESLRKARAGIYRSWSFRGAPEWLIRDYFVPHGTDEIRIRAEIREAVEFRQLNLATDTYPALPNHTNGLDLIFCRNVLMYFSPSQVKRVVAALSRSLAPGGFLVLGVCENSPDLGAGLRTRTVGAITCYQAADNAPASASPRGTSLAVPSADAFIPIEPCGTGELDEPHGVDGAAVLARAELLFASGDYDAAIDALQPWLEQGARDPDAAALLARAYANRGDLAAACRWIDRALTIDKLRPALHFLRGTVLQEQGEWAQAAASFELALYLDPTHVPARLALAEAAERGGDRDKASRHWAQALRIVHRREPGEIIPEAEGLTAGRLAAIIESRRNEGGP